MTEFPPGLELIEHFLFTHTCRSEPLALKVQTGEKRGCFHIKKIKLNQLTPALIC